MLFVRSAWDDGRTGAEAESDGRGVIIYQFRIEFSFKITLFWEIIHQIVWIIQKNVYLCSIKSKPNERL